MEINCGFPNVSILGPLLLIKYINELAKGLIDSIMLVDGTNPQKTWHTAIITTSKN